MATATTLRLRAGVRNPGGEHTAREPEPCGRAEHRLVREIEDEIRLELAQRQIEVVVSRNAVVRLAPQLLGPAEHHGADELVGQRGERVADRRCVVLAVDQGKSARHLCEVTSSSIRAVYFSNARVSVEN